MAASSCARFMRCCLRLWKPVRYSCLASLSNEISAMLCTIFRFLLGGGSRFFFGRGLANMLKFDTGLWESVKDVDRVRNRRSESLGEKRKLCAATQKKTSLGSSTIHRGIALKSMFT